MRTTLNLDPDTLAKVRILAKQRGMSLGAVVSELIRKALSPEKAPSVRNGVPIFAPREGSPPDLELVNRLRD
jgi:plasmid stability protein